MTPEQWNALFLSAVSPKRFRDAVEREVRLYLAHLEMGEMVSTENVVEHLYPRAVAEQSLTGDSARTRIYAVMAKLPYSNLEDCCMKGKVTGQFMGKPKRPWLWFSPGDIQVCTSCGQILPTEEV